MKILGIETSCDETAVSVVEAGGEIDSPVFNLLSSAVNSQIEIHKEYGGVVPNIAKREHTKNLSIVLDEALKKADVTSEQIDLIAVTVGPGLEPALWCGITFAKEISEKWQKPLIGVNHMEGHIASVFLTNTKEKEASETIFSLGHKDKALQNDFAGFFNNKYYSVKINFPILALLISGGHTELVLLKSWNEKEKVGETQDDAVGEAFDKVARMMNLSYPGGPKISKLAEEAREKNINLDKKFPRPMIHSGDLNFSFSGLKTAVLYYLRDLEKETDQKSFSSKSPRISSSTKVDSARLFSENFSGQLSPSEDNQTDELSMAVAREFEDAVIETLLTKTKTAIEKYSPKTFVIGGGVISNKALREKFLELKNEYPELVISIPEKNLTTDNAAMIAAVGYIQYLRCNGKISDDQDLRANGNLDIS